MRSTVVRPSPVPAGHGGLPSAVVRRGPLRADPRCYIGCYTRARAAALEAAGQALGVDPEDWRAVTSLPAECWT